MAKLPQGDTILPKLLPDASLGLGRCLVNKWNLGPEDKRIGAALRYPPRLIGTAFAPRQGARRARPKTDQRRGYQCQSRIYLKHPGEQRQRTGFTSRY